MSLKWFLILIPALALVAEDQAPPPAWATKPVATWTQEEAQQVLKDSPWAKSVTPGIVRDNPENRGYPQRPMGRRGGFGFPGGGYPGGGYPGGYPQQNPYPQNPPPKDSGTADEKAPVLTVRWESALPVREAELKARDENAPTLEDENHYAVAVYGIPASVVNGDLKSIADECKKKTTLSRDGKKDLKPSSVQVLRREDGPVVLILFLKPKNAKEAITKDDRRVEFDSQIRRYSISQGFYLDDMTFQGKTEL